MKDVIIAVCLGALFIFGMYSCAESDWYKKDQQEKAEQEQRDRTPHVIREADGCKVYAFKADDKTHFFTRCGSTVQTDRNYTVNCGKNCTRQETETITTEGNKP